MTEHQTIERGEQAASQVVDGPVRGRPLDDPGTYEPAGMDPAALPPIDAETGGAMDEGRPIDGHAESNDRANGDPVGVGLELTQMPVGTLHA